MTDSTSPASEAVVEITDADRKALEDANNMYASYMGDPDGNEDYETAREESAKVIARHRISALTPSTPQPVEHPITRANLGIGEQPAPPADAPMSPQMDGVLRRALLSGTEHRYDIPPADARENRDDPDEGPIGPGHVCKHGIRWQHGCTLCDRPHDPSTDARENAVDGLLGPAEARARDPDTFARADKIVGMYCFSSEGERQRAHEVARIGINQGKARAILSPKDASPQDDRPPIVAGDAVREALRSLIDAADALANSANSGMCDEAKECARAALSTPVSRPAADLEKAARAAAKHDNFGDEDLWKDYRSDVRAAFAALDITFADE